jgi:hypothetical protein
MDLNYQVGGHIFTDKFQAALQAHRNNQDIYFNLFDSAFDTVDWSREPNQSWDQLLDLRAQQIAAKNRPIVLHFSGGTDSYTIYKVFERNKIHLSALIMNYRGDLSDIAYTNVHEFLKKGIYDPHCEIIIDNYLASNSWQEIYQKPDWCWTSMERYQFGIFSGYGNGDQRLSVKFGKEVISVLGTDKPRLRFTPQGIYSYQDDITWVRHIKSPNLDSFYISQELPELHVKQSWMLKTYLQQKFAVDQNSADFFLVNSHCDPEKFSWSEYSTASGRYGDLANSHIQHFANKGTRLLVPKNGGIDDAVYTGRQWKEFERLRGTSTFRNYVGGLIAASKDGAGQYLGMNTNNLLYVRSLYSKGHCMPW